LPGCQTCPPQPPWEGGRGKGKKRGEREGEKGDWKGEEGSDSTALLSLPIAFLPFPFSTSLSLPPLSFPFPSCPLEVGPLKLSQGVWGIAVSSHSGVWGGAPAKIEFGAF